MRFPQSSTLFALTKLYKYKVTCHRGNRSTQRRYLGLKSVFKRMRSEQKEGGVEGFCGHTDLAPVKLAIVEVK